MKHESGVLSFRFRALALAAGEETLLWFGKAEARGKEDGSPVTQADLAADAVICAGLAESFPDIPIVTEERAETHKTAETFFLVDPLDGTKEFVSGRPDYTVNIGLIHQGRPVAGVVYAPAKKRLFRTLPGGIAAEEDLETGRLRKLAVRPAPERLAIVASKSHNTPETQAWIDRHPVGSLVNAGSSLKFCLVAAGEADLYPRLGRTMEWDTAAAHAVLAAAGGLVERLEDGAPLLYGKPGFENPHFVARSPSVALR